MDYVERLNFLQLDSLEVRRIKADLILYYKVINNLVQIDTANLTRHKHSFRGHNLYLYTFYCRTEIRKYFWCNRIVCPWNSLDCSIVNTASLCQFKNFYKMCHSMVGVLLTLLTPLVYFIVYVCFYQ